MMATTIISSIQRESALDLVHALHRHAGRCGSDAASPAPRAPAIGPYNTAEVLVTPADPEAEELSPRSRQGRAETSLQVVVGLVVAPVVAPIDAQLLEPVAQRAEADAQQRCRALAHPSGLFECAKQPTSAHSH